MRHSVAGGECMWAGPTHRRKKRLGLNRGTKTICEFERLTNVNIPFKNRVP